MLQFLAPILIVIATSVTTRTTFSKELGHLNSNLSEHVHQLGHHIAITLRVNKTRCLAQVTHSACSSNPVNILVDIIWHVVVDAGGGQTLSRQISGQEVRILLGLDEDQGSL